jgi:hypothetical protein
MIENKSVYVVEFDTMPKLPITGLTEEEQACETFELDMKIRVMEHLMRKGLPVRSDLMTRSRSTYANALTNAIESGIITKPGKYGIHLVPGTNDYEIYNIIED